MEVFRGLPRASHQYGRSNGPFQPALTFVSSEKKEQVSPSADCWEQVWSDSWTVVGR